MKKILPVLLFIINTICLSAQNKVQIIINASNVADTENIFISGNLPELGSWNPGLVNLNKLNDSTWSIDFYFLKNTFLEFKFTKGDWSREALNSQREVEGNHNLLVANDTCLYFNIVHWNNGQKKLSGQITGKVVYHKNFTSRYVLPRDIIVWLPPSYNSQQHRKYPVLYMQDGQNIIDPGTSAFGVDWQIDETADSLIQLGLIEELIIVGIYNTNRRSSEYANTSEGEAYLNFITSELKPFIDSSYQTLSDSKNTAVTGSSLGGLISFMLVWEFPDLFSKTACLSTAFKIDNYDYVAPVKAYIGAKKEIMLYIDNGGIGLEQALQPGIDEMLTALRNKGYVENQDLLYIKDIEAEHNEAAWAKRTANFLKFFFPKQK